MSYRLLISTLLFTLCLNGQPGWEITGGPNNNRVDYLHKAGGMYYMTGVNVCYRSADANNWTKLNLPTPNGFSMQLYITSSGNRLFIAGIYLGVLHSDDQGATWVNDNISAPWSIYTSGTEVCVATYATLHRSTDSGTTWQTLTVPSGIIRGMTRYKGELYIQTNDGAIHRRDSVNNSWITINSWGPINIGVSNVNNTLYNDADQMLYVTGYGNLFRTSSENTALVDITPNNCGWIHSYRLFNNEIFICATNSVYKSNKVTVAWMEVCRLNYPHDVIFHNNDLYIGTGDGLYRKSKTTNTWEKLFKGIDPEAQIDLTNMAIRYGHMKTVHQTTAKHGLQLTLTQ